MSVLLMESVTPFTNKLNFDPSMDKLSHAKKI